MYAKYGNNIGHEKKMSCEYTVESCKMSAGVWMSRRRSLLKKIPMTATTIPSMTLIESVVPATRFIAGTLPEPNA